MEIDVKKQSSLTAKKLSWILSGSLGILTIGLFVGVWYAGNLLKERTDAVRALEAQAHTNVTNLEKAQALSVFVAKNAEEMHKAASIVADTQLYQHQNQIVKDITDFANTAGLTVLGFNFPENKQATQRSTAAKTGLKSVSATISLESPVEYKKMLTFIKLIERNLTRMQITTIDISADQLTPGLIRTPSIGIEVYIR